MGLVDWGVPEVVTDQSLGRLGRQTWGHGGAVSCMKLSLRVNTAFGFQGCDEGTEASLEIHPLPTGPV